MTILTREIVSRFSGVGDLGFKAIAATDGLQSDGFALQMPAGADISRLNSGRANLLMSHEEIIGKIRRAWFEPGKLMFEGEFPAPGVSKYADENRALLKAGHLSSTSLSFVVQDKVKIPGGYRATKWTALEVSLCAVPVDPGSYVTERAHRAGKVISSSNMSKLKAAHAAIMEAGGHVSDVMGMNDQDGDEGERSADFRRRQAECLALARPEHEFWAAREAKRHAELDEELRDPAARRREAARLAAVRY